MSMFIALEGYDGVGKSSVAELLSVRIPNSVLIKNPGYTEAGRMFRDILLNPEWELTLDAQPFLFLADMVHTIQKKIIPTLAEGKNVICDRYLASTWVYQVATSGIVDIKRKGLIEQMIIEYALTPTTTVILDAPVDIAMARAKRRTREFSKKDVFEASNKFTWEARRVAYLSYKDSNVCKEDCIIMSTEDINISDLTDKIITKLNMEN